MQRPTKDDDEDMTDAQKGKSDPLSLEELLKKRQEQAALEAKPKFLSKKEREALALERRQKEVAAMRGGGASAGGSSGAAGGHLAAGSLTKEWQRQAREAEAQARDAERRQRHEEKERSMELENIKKQYLGEKKAKKKVIKPSEKFKLISDWDNSEDTSKDLNPLYNSTHEAAVLFGRGLRAGIDRREQKKAMSAHEQDLRDMVRKAAGVSETQEERDFQQDQAKRAEERYDKLEKTEQEHWSNKPLDKMTQRDWRIFREDYDISTRGTRLPLPLRNWEEASMIPRELYKAIIKVGYKKPSPIQMAAIPIGIQQRDVIGIAETGSGKTCAFVVPMLAYIMKQPPMDETIEQDGPYALVMAPTRELAQQIEAETCKFAHYLNYRVVTLVGGQDIEAQAFKLRRGTEIVVGTPGRIIDCIESRYTALNQCNYIVLDEADRMIDMGFEPQVQQVMDKLPSSNLKPANEEEELETNRLYRTTYMFSATMPPAVEKLARSYLRQPVVVNIGSAGKAADRIRQDIIWCTDKDRPRLLEQVLEKQDDIQVIVFVNTKKSCDLVAKTVQKLGYYATMIHGGKTQDQREESLNGFREKEYNILIATDVAGRGIDVPDVGLVINYEIPTSGIQAYTHRIGRTGRAGKSGVALSFLTPWDKDIFFDLKTLLEASGNVVPSELARHEASRIDPKLQKQMQQITK